MTESRNPEAKRSTIELPLRGLAGEGAEPLVRTAMERVPGVVAVEVEVSSYRVRVTYDALPGTREAIEAALHTLGPVSAHANADSRPAP